MVVGDFDAHFGVGGGLVGRVGLGEGGGDIAARCRRWRFHTWKPVYRGLSSIARTAVCYQTGPLASRCELRPGSEADGMGCLLR